MENTERLSLKRRIYRKFCVLFSKQLPDRLYLQLLYEARMGKRLHLDLPMDFNEKMQWLKLYDRNPEYTKMADKYAVRDLVAKRLGEEYLIPLLGVWDSPKQIDFEKLPDRFVLKCTHDSASVCICKDKAHFDRQAAIEKLQRALETNYFYASREFPYRDIRPRVLAEAYMVDESGTELKDYKVYTFGGKPRLIQVDFDRFCNHRRNLYTTDWAYIDETIEYPKDPSVNIPRPERLEEMLDCAGKLAKGTASLRTDFYSVNGRIYFGEITFYQEAGFAHFEHDDFARKLGDMIELPDKRLLIERYRNL